MVGSPLIFVSAGEASGDHYGAELIASVRAAAPATRFTGLGGASMEAAGQRRVVRAEDVAVMGITEILQHVPRIVQSYRKLVRSLHTETPDAAVLIDFPDVNFRLAKHLKRLGIPVIWFVSPQLWAWKRRRLRWVQSRVDRMLTIFPFEEEFYRKRGVSAEFVGHPLAEAPLPDISREAYAAQFGMDTEKQWIALLPGSRRSELRKNLPAMVGAAARLGPSFEYIVPVAPTLDKGDIRSVQLPLGAVKVHYCTDARAALLHSRAAVVASGTATVQAAVIGTPFVAVYRVSAMTFRLAKRLVRYPPEIHAEIDHLGNLPIVMPNLVAGQRVVPELLQKQFTADAVAAQLFPLLVDSPQREAQLQGLAEVRMRLLRADGVRSMDCLRNAVLDALNTAVSAPSSARAASASND